MSDVASIQQQILDAFKTGDIDTVELALATAMRLYRASFIQSLDDLFLRSDQRLKGILFEFLCNNGGKDVVASLARIAKAEKNPLTARKFVTDMGNIAQTEAIDALEEIESQLSAEVQRVAQRSLGKLRAQFREYYYVKEFQKGSHNIKRLRSAAEQMIKSPAPFYMPYLLQALLSDDSELQREAVRVLSHTGSHQAIPELLSLLQRLLHQKDNCSSLLQLPFLKKFDGKSKAKEHMEQLLRQPLIAKDDRIGGIYTNYMLGSANLNELIDAILDTFGIQSKHTREPSKRLLFRMLNLPEEVTTNELERMCQTLDTHALNLIQIMREVCLALGSIAYRSKIEERLMAELESLIPEENPARPELIVSALAGTPSPQAQRKLLGFLEDTLHPGQAERILDALSNLAFEEIPEPIVKMAHNLEHGNLRRRAMEIIAKSNNANAQIFRKLLLHPALVIKADSIQIVAAFQIEACYPDLIALFERELPESLLLVLIQEISHFDTELTGTTVQKYMLPPKPLAIRLAALETLCKAGGPNNYALVTEALGTYNANKLEELAMPYIEYLDKTLSSDNQALIFEQRLFFLKIINHPNAKIRTRAIAMLERVEWNTPDAEDWAQLFQGSFSQLVGQRSTTEQERLRYLLNRVNNVLEVALKAKKSRDQIEDLLKRFRNPTQFEKVQALRELNLINKPDVFENNPQGVKQLARDIESFLASHADVHKMEILAIETAGKIGHPLTRNIAVPFLNHPNWGIANSAKRAVETPLNPNFRSTFIQSVLLVDDSNYITNLLERLLQAKGYQPTCANEPEQAIEIAKKDYFDLMIFDLKMPGMDGAQMVRKMHEWGCCPPFRMVCTGNRNRDDLMEVSREGVDGIILKPFQAADILKRIQELVEQNFKEIVLPKQDK